MILSIVSILAQLLAQAGTGAVVTPNPAHGTFYTGPGDVLPGATAWYGLRGYNRAFAGGNNPAITVRRASDNTTANVVILPGGALNIAGANSFAGVDATCTGTAAASTTLSLTSCISTPKAGDTLTSTGGTGSFTQPAYIVSCGSFVAGSGTCTLNVAQTVTGVTVSAQVGLFITKAFDQTGNGIHVTQGTNASQPQLLPSCLNGLPCMFFNGAQSLTAGSATACAINGLQFFMNSVGERTGNTSAFSMLFSACGGGFGSKIQSIYNNSPNQFATQAGGGNPVLTATASDNAAHILQIYTPYFGNSSIVVDNTTTTGAAGNTAPSGSGTGATLGDVSTGSSAPLTGYIMEAGGWQLPITANLMTNLCVNDNNYWFAGGKSCTTTVAPTVYANVTEPCDLVTCADAWSVTRAMTTNYTGPLFQLYNGTTVLDIGQNTTTRKADMTTWSAFCSGVQSNCTFSRIYSQIQRGQNDLVPVVFKGACAPPIFGCGTPFSIEAATGLPIMNVSGTGGQEYTINNIGQSATGATANDFPITGVNVGTNPLTIMVNEFIPFQTSPCCGGFGLAHIFSVAGSAGQDFMWSNSWNTNFGVPPTCDTNFANNYCFIVDAENSGAAADSVLLSNVQFSYVGFMDHTTSPSVAVDLYYNGHTGFQNTPPLTAINLPNPSYLHFGGGGDLSQPAPTIWREALMVNSIISSTARSNIFSNSTAFYSGLSFP